MPIEYEPQKFVSSKVISKDREAIKEARERVLRDAERKAEHKWSRDEVAKARGDDKWMLPVLDDQLKKKKKKKKDKKEKKKKKKKDKGSSSEDEWEESGNNLPGEKVKEEEETKRDDWMEMGKISTYSRNDIMSKKDKRELERREREAAAAPGASKYELNPYFAKGGTGLPPTESKPTPAAATSQSTTMKSDGGVSWLQRAFKRAEQQAKDENVPLEEIAIKRWGSLEKFNELLAAAKKKAGMADKALPDLKNGSSHRRERSRSRDRNGSSSRRDRSRSSERSKRQRSRSRSRDRRRERSRSRDKRRERSRSRSREGRKRSPSWEESRGHKFARPGQKIDKNSKSANRYSSSGGWKTKSRLDEERNKQLEKERERKKRAPSSSSSSSSESEQEEDKEGNRAAEPEEEAAADTVRPKILTESELNALSAKMVKAEIMGNDDLVEELKAKIANARETRTNFIAQGGDPDQVETETITKIKLHDTKTKRKKTKVETHKDGQRVRYFGDDDKYDLQQMYEREKMNAAEDQNDMLSNLASKAHEKTNDDFDMDDLLITKAARKKNEEQEEQKAQNKVAQQLVDMEKTLEDCKWCIGSRRSNKHLMVSMGKSVYLSVPGCTSMAEGHCLIVPMGHIASGSALDEDVWHEIQDYRKALVQMFRSRDEDCVFIETAMGFKKHPHMVIECIPVPDDLGSMAPMYFQKAIQECEYEWSDNKKLIKLKDRKIGANVPKGLPYFHVDFGNDTGFAHVIEDEANWSRRFGHEIVGGMMDVEARTFRNPAWENFDAQKRKVIAFSNMWKEYDWTKKLQKKKEDDSSSSSSSEDDENE